MKKFVVMAILLSFSVGHAFEIALNCKDDKTGQSLNTQVVKHPYKSSTGKWAARYDLVVAGQQGIPFLDATDGDEDYTTYPISDEASKQTGIMNVTIQKAFAWATLTNNAGYLYAHCSK